MKFYLIENRTPRVILNFSLSLSRRMAPLHSSAIVAIISFNLRYSNKKIILLFYHTVVIELDQIDVVLFIYLSNSSIQKNITDTFILK